MILKKLEVLMLLGLAANKKLNAKKAAECCDLSGKNFVEADGVEVRSA